MNEVFLLWGFGLFALAALLLVLELFIPSGGLLGALAGIASIAGVFSFFRHSSGWGLTSLGALIVLAPVSVSLMLKIWPHTPVGKKMILGSPGTEGAEHARADALEREKERLELEALIGQEGDALTDLRPVGEIVLGGVRHEGLAQGPAIEQGARVRVVDVEGYTLKVREA